MFWLREADASFRDDESTRRYIDLVIYDEEQDACELYEVKHSTQIVNRQYHALMDQEACTLVEKKYGTIIRKCVLYRGKPTVLENGIVYENVEQYLKALGG